jgi:hypothetical protein
MALFQNFDRDKEPVGQFTDAMSRWGTHHALVQLCLAQGAGPGTAEGLATVLERYFDEMSKELLQRWYNLELEQQHLDALEQRLREQGVDHLPLRCPAQYLKACAMWKTPQEYFEQSETQCPTCRTPRTTGRSEGEG